MSEEINSAAETPNTEATPSVEAAGTPEAKTDDLDALLEQYRKETGSPGTPQAAPAAVTQPAGDVVPRSEFDALKDYVTKTTRRVELEEIAKGIRAAGDIPDILSDEDIIGIVDRRAFNEPALAKAWQDGDAKIRTKLLSALGKELGAKFAKYRGVDEQATADREAVAASVRGASTKAPEGKAPDFGKMTDNEFRKEAEKYGITF